MIPRFKCRKCGDIVESSAEKWTMRYCKCGKLGVDDYHTGTYRVIGTEYLRWDYSKHKWISYFDEEVAQVAEQQNRIADKTGTEFHDNTNLSPCGCGNHDVRHYRDEYYEYAGHTWRAGCLVERLLERVEELENGH